MNKIDTKHTTAFIVFFFFLALCINSTHSRRVQIYVSPAVQEQQQQQEELEKQKAAAARQAAEEAAAQHAAFLARYLNGGFSKTPGSKTLALVVATADGKMDPTIGAVLASHFKNNVVQISTSFFKPEFVSDNLFGNIFGGSTEIINKLELAKSLDALMLARLTVQYSTSPATLDNVMTAHVRLEIQVVPINDGFANGAIDVSEFKELKNPLVPKRVGLEQQIVALERSKLNRLEPLRKWVLEANTAEKAVSSDNWLEMKSFLKKVGSNRLLRAQTLTVSFKKPFHSLAETTIAVRSTSDVSAQSSLWWSQGGSNS